jgi:hypothetical protein
MVYRSLYGPISRHTFTAVRGFYLKKLRYLTKS